MKTFIVPMIAGVLVVASCGLTQAPQPTQSTNDIELRWLMITPFGWPVEPDV